MEVELFKLSGASVCAEPPEREVYAPVAMLPRAWRQSRGENVVVAVIDTGLDWTHPDLELAFLDAGDEDVDDFVGHGTHVAGIIGARFNGKGAAGVAPDCTIVPYKCVPGTWQGAARALNEAIALDADIVNMSFGGTEPPPDYFYDAVERAYQKGIVLVAAAGNSGGEMTYPAKCSRVVPVAATDSKNAAAPFSSHGSDLERGFCAVGVDVFSTWPGGKYARLSGTSMAAPQIAGLFALTIAKHRAKEGSTPIGPKGPGRVDALIQHLEWAAKKAGSTAHFGHGYIDGSRCL